MPRLVNTEEVVVVKVEDQYGVATTTRSKYGVLVVERPIVLDGGDAMDAITICLAVNAMMRKKK